MHKILAVALAGLLLQTSHSWSQTPQVLDPVVVTATKLDTPAREVARTVTVITEEDIKNRQHKTVLDALKTIPAVDVVRTGGLGQQTSVFMRGANSEHTLVLIDGVPVNDPISPSRFYDFANLTTDNIEQIEVVRGPGSTLYGSDALGGVINIITKKGSGKPRVSFSVEGGSYETHRESAGLSGGTDRINYSLTASFLDSNGIGAASRKDGNKERDGYQNFATSARIGLTPTDNFDLDFIVRYIDSDADLDNSGGPGGDDPNFRLKNTSLFLSSQARLILFNDLWEQKLSVSLTDFHRRSTDGIDAARPFDSSRSTYDSNLYKIDWQHNLFLTETNTLTLGVEYREEQGKQRDKRTFEAFDPITFLPLGIQDSSFSEVRKQTASTVGYYLQDQIRLWERFFTTVGLRLNDHEEFGSRTTYQIASTYLFPSSGTKIRASYGTGFRAPSLLQLYDPVFGGNPDLDPEKSTGWDVGLEQALLHDHLFLSLTYFENDFKDLIVNQFTGLGFEYMNIDKAETKGVELSVTCKPAPFLTLRAGYTYTDTENKETGEDLVRRPKNKFTADAIYQFLDRGNVSLNLLHVSKRDDVYFNNVTFESGRLELPSYTVLNLATSFDVTDNIRLFGRVDNLLDKEYQEVWGYDTAGISGYLGAEFTF